MTLARSVALAVAAAISGCTWLGPDIVRSGRPAYNDAILASGDEQLLQNIVRMRFVDSIGFLAVSSVTANVSVTATGGVQLPFGSESNYSGNLVPFTGTLRAEQNPTISYTPVDSAELLRRFATPMPIDMAILVTKSAHAPAQAWRTVARRVNNLRNPDFPDPPRLVVDPRFEEVAELAGTLQHHGSLYWARRGGAEPRHVIVLNSYSPGDSREVARLLELLGIAKPAREGDDVVIPVQLSVGTPTPGTVSIETRSLLDLMRLAAASIDLPADTYGAARFPVPGLAGRGIHIRSSILPPYEPRVAAQYRQRWYYIANDDDSSKQWFNLLQLLSSAQLQHGTAATAPVLTIPVSGRR